MAGALCQGSGDSPKVIGTRIVSSRWLHRPGNGVQRRVSAFVISLIFSFYVLQQKEKAGPPRARQGDLRPACTRLMPTFGRPASVRRTFSSFLSGRYLGPAFWARCSSLP